MRQQPGPDELARLAAAILGDDKLPEDRSARSYEQRLAAKALSIAAYDREHAAVDRGEELRLFGADTVAAAASDDETRIAALNRRLATEIRAGDWDEPTDALKTLLMAQTRARLARTNPKYLKARLSED
jgi:hypothetical protein